MRRAAGQNTPVSKGSVKQTSHCLLIHNLIPEQAWEKKQVNHDKTPQTQQAQKTIRKRTHPCMQRRS